MRLLINIIALVAGLALVALGLILATLPLVNSPPIYALLGIAGVLLMPAGLELCHFAFRPEDKPYRLFPRGYRGLLVDLLGMLLAACLMVATVNYRHPSHLLCDGRLSAGFPLAFICDASGESPLGSVGRIDWADLDSLTYLGAFVDILFYLALLWLARLAMGRFSRRRPAASLREAPPPSMNYFAAESAAERYARGRPYVHPQVISRVKAFLAITDPFPRALDLACGTGLSTLALKDIAQQVIGADISAPMLALAPRDPCIDYLVAPAEKLPLANRLFDLMTLSSAFHWIDRAAFFAEARRVLKPGAWLIIYDNAFSGEMQENPAFQLWTREHFLTKYPTPPRAPVVFEQDSLEADFQLAGREGYQNQVEFSTTALVDYLVTQSNVIAVVGGQKQKIEHVRKWLTDHVTPFFSGRPRATFIFGGSIWYLRRALP